MARGPASNSGNTTQKHRVEVLYRDRNTLKQEFAPDRLRNIWLAALSTVSSTDSVIRAGVSNRQRTMRTIRSAKNDHYTVFQ